MRREDAMMSREEVEAVVARRRPGWHVVDVTLVTEESGSYYEVAIVREDERRTLLVGPDREIAGERR
jgi:uncharacterized membrane protein YkoI